MMSDGDGMDALQNHLDRSPRAMAKSLRVNNVSVSPASWTLGQRIEPSDWSRYAESYRLRRL